MALYPEFSFLWGEQSVLDWFANSPFQPWVRHTRTASSPKLPVTTLEESTITRSKLRSGSFETPNSLSNGLILYREKLISELQIDCLAFWNSRRLSERRLEHPRNKQKQLAVAEKLSWFSNLNFFLMRKPRVSHYVEFTGMLSRQ